METTTLHLKTFAQSGIKKIKDILSDDNTRVKADGELHYKRNWISEWSKMKSAVKNIIQKLNDNEESNSKLIMNNLVFFGVKKTRVTKLKVKHIKYILLKGKTPKVQSKWNTEFNKDFDWKVLWRNLHNCPTASKIKDLQWKCAHNIIYTEYLPGSHDFEFTIYNVMLGFDIDNDITCVCNLLLFTAKWVIWKERNLIKYQQKVNSVIQLFNMFKFILIDNLKYSVKCEKIMSKRNKLELLIANIEK